MTRSDDPEDEVMTHHKVSVVVGAATGGNLYGTYHQRVSGNLKDETLYTL
jgi:hypothetical protein